MNVWIDQDLCTGDGRCDEIAPDVFFGMHDGLFYVKESADTFVTEKLFDGAADPAGSEGMARIPDGGIERVIEAAEECPRRTHLHRRRIDAGRQRRRTTRRDRRTRNGCPINDC